MNFQDRIYNLSPHFVQEWIVTVYDWLQYRKRHGGVYFKEKEYLRSFDKVSFEKLQKEQNRLLSDFLEYCKANSKYYASKISEIDRENPIESLLSLRPMLKEELRRNLNTIRTIDKKGASVGKTGGTTGKSLEVYYLLEDSQKRFAMLDVFRERFDYRFGARTAWFSGKQLLTSRDIAKQRFWKTDRKYNIKYYSTFHISDKYIKYYINNLIEYRPEFIVGFPSSIVEIARYALRNNLQPLDFVKAIFPTAETKDPVEARDIEAYFGAKVRDQYASSEGANFITECEEGNLHYDMLTGIIEVVDDNYLPAKEGRILLTSFTTRGTPLIRYDIGDRVRLSDKNNCACGRNTPLIEEILGRINDYIWSPENGKINLGNISNCVKNITEIVKFQIVQDLENAIKVKIVKGQGYTNKDEQIFLKELRARTGSNMIIDVEYITDIPLESSGKFRMIKNQFAQQNKTIKIDE